MALIFRSKKYALPSTNWLAVCRKPVCLTIMLGAVVAVIAGLGLFPAQATQQSLPTANIVIVQNRDHYPAGDTYPIDFEITIARDWNIHGPRKSEEGLIPTRLAFDPVPGIAVIDLAFPDPEMVKFDYAIDPVAVYDGTILVKARLRISADHPEGIAPLAGRLSFQACSATLCRPPESVAFNFLITIGAPDAVAKGLNVNSDVDAGTDGSVAGEKSQFAFWLTLAGIFLGGLALNLTPCIYPLIPVTISYFGSKSENIQGRTVLHAAIYLAGLSLTNAALGVSAALSGAMLGAVLQHPLVLILLAAVLMALALSMFGLWDLNAPGLLARFVSRNPAGYWGTFFMGLTLGIVAAPCIGPFILGLLTYVGQTGNPLLGFVYFLVLSIGMGLPLCILAAFSGSVRRLPRSGQWMMWVKKAMGWIMVGMAAYLVRPLLPASFAKDPLIFLVMIAAGIHLGFMEKTDVQLRKFNIAKKIMGTICVLAAILLWVAAAGPVDGPNWEPYTPEAVVAAKMAGSPVMLDFYADWCLPCRELDHRTFSDKQVRALAGQFKPLRLDLTQRQPEQDEILRRYGIRGVPTVVFIDAKGNELSDLRVTAFVNARELAARMESALKASHQ